MLEKNQKNKYKQLCPSKLDCVSSECPPDRPGFTFANHTRGLPYFLCTCHSWPQLPPRMRAYVCACVRHTCSCSCVLPAKGPLSLPGQTALSPLDRWPAPSLLLHIPSLHLPLIPFFHHCLPLLRALDTPQPPLPSFPSPQQPPRPPQRLCRSKKWIKTP